MVPFGAGKYHPGQGQGGPILGESIFTESSREVYTPRAVYVDLEPSVLHKIQGRREIFSPDKFVSGKEDSASNYWRGFYQLVLETPWRILSD